MDLKDFYAEVDSLRNSDALDDLIALIAAKNLGPPPESLELKIAISNALKDAFSPECCGNI